MEGVDAGITEIREQTLHSPYYTAILKEFGKKVPERREALKIVFGAFDSQMFANFDSYESEKYPGVAFSFSKVSVSPNLIRKLSAQTYGIVNTTEQLEALKEDESETEVGQEERTVAKRQDFFLFAAMGRPPGSNVFTVEDVALDRFVRLLPRVAWAIKNGETPPEINIYLLGSTYGFGGRVTPEWIRLLKDNGLEENGELYAEFIEQHEQISPEQLKNTHIVLQGNSKGAIIADITSRHLRQDLQGITQRLLDTPVGHHNPESKLRWIKGSQVVVGLAAEILFSMFFDSVMKSVIRQDKEFLDKLSKAANVPADDEEQKKLKNGAAFTEGWLMVRGTPLDTEDTRSFIREAIYDPLSTGPQRISEIWLKRFGPKRIFNFFQGKKDIGLISFSNGRSLKTPFSATHFNLHKRFGRWGKILDYCQGAVANK